MTKQQILRYQIISTKRYFGNNEYIESDPNRASNSRTIKRRSTAYTNCIRTSNEVEATSR